MGTNLSKVYLLSRSASPSQSCHYKWHVKKPANGHQINHVESDALLDNPEFIVNKYIIISTKDDCVEPVFIQILYCTFALSSTSLD